MSTITIQEEAQMEVVPFRFQLDGRLRNIGRPKEWYMAVAEAVKNAFDAIEASGRTGQIEVELQRGEDLLSSVGTAGPVQNVIIRDTGIGFDQTNFESFCTPDSLLKSTAGGKGLGRFICLQAFKRMEGTSVYRNGIGSMRREFVFQSEKPELRQLLVPIKAEENLTEVMLLGLREEYLPTATVEFEKLVDWLGEHFLPALVEKPDWLQALIVRDGNKREDLTAKISAGAIWRESFKVKNYDFNTACYAFAHDDDCDQVRLVAGARVVDASTRGLGYYVPHLENVADEKGHVVLVTSPFFDEHVNDARNGISFYEEGEEQALFGITAAQFRQGLAEALTHKLIGRLTRSNLDLRNRIEAVVRKEAPPYRPLLEGYFASKEFMQVRPAVRDEEILASLDLYRRHDALSLKKESRRLAKLHSESADYQESARKLADQIETQKKVALAEYVSLRKILLDRLEHLLEAKEDGRAQFEKVIHNLIFPQRADSQSTPGIEHQLWILDERLESHAYLASDQPLDGRQGNRPDLVVALDSPGAFASESAPRASGYERIVLVEFKRALRDLADEPTDELPHRQMMRYARQIGEGKAVHYRTRRPIKTTTDARFYCYAVCEMSAEFLKRLVREEEFVPSPTGDGAFAVKNEARYYLEYISLDKLLEDAKARNSAFFKRLGLEPS